MDNTMLQIINLLISLANENKTLSDTITAQSKRIDGFEKEKQDHTRSMKAPVEPSQS